MKKILLLFSLLCCLLSARAMATGPTTTTTAITADFLRADGTLNLPAMAGQNLSLDLKGWNVSLDPKLGPVFAPAATGFNALDKGLNGTVYAIAVSSTGDVYVGGTFTAVGTGGTAVSGLSNIAKWNGTAWSALGSGLNAGVSAIAVSSTGDVYVGGDFLGVGSGGTAVTGLKYIAKWNGTAWSALGSGLNAAVYAIAVSSTGDVYVGGYFTGVGGFTPVAGLNRIAKWNGTAWSALGSGLSSYVYDIALSGSDVYVGGAFTDVGSGTAVAGLNRIAKWNGTAWSALGTGLNRTVYAIAVSSTGDVYVGGGICNRWHGWHGGTGLEPYCQMEWHGLVGFG